MRGSHLLESGVHTGKPCMSGVFVEYVWILLESQNPLDTLKARWNDFAKIQGNAVNSLN